MSSVPPPPSLREIVVDELFSHPTRAVWKALTSGALMERWMMRPSGFEPIKGCTFTFQTKPAGAWDGVIHCKVLEATPDVCLAYSWTGGHEENVGYGSKLDTVVTWTLTESSDGTRLRLVHSGFELPKNETALTNMSDGWRTVVPRLRSTIDLAKETAQPNGETPL